ncbi:MAG: AGE family epimerase/isomerase, partial [Cyclobacteriaceae bacterium]|nr:AGE family epimerase/isomerase [Cyclobacteriaceae bacterium HetDA_MAG_MS6]
MEKLQSYQKQYTHSLLDDVIPFWDKFSIDQKRGGYFTCLDNDGKIYDSDKFVWLQARQVWTYAMLHNRLDSSPQWLQTAKIGAEFLDAYAFDSSGNCFFSLDRNGNPLVQP